MQALRLVIDTLIDALCARTHCAHFHVLQRRVLGEIEQVRR